jgi:hypothetical protein
VEQLLEIGMKKVTAFEADYFYPTRLGVLKKATGSLADFVAA